jgi:diguanylate cyclase (GGDEF)-like protein
MEETIYHILFLEDSGLIREKVSPLLRGGRLGRFAIHEAATLAEGLATVRNVHVDAVLLDLGLPDSRGLHTLRAVRKAIPHVAVVILTADDCDDTVIERANYDSLTGLYSRPHLLEKLRAALREAREADTPLTACLCDLDQLKEVNDTYGHRQGDRVLETFGALVRRGIEASGFGGRYGGDEFLIVLPALGADRAEELVERIRSSLSGHDFLLSSGETLHVTSTFGLASLTPAMITSRELIQAADEALYEGKKEGHDRVVRAD